MRTCCFVASILLISGCSVSLIGGRHIDIYILNSENAAPLVTMKAPSKTKAKDLLSVPLTDIPDSITDYIDP